MASRIVRILCFGDSLTEGFTRGGMKMKPYSRVLKSLLDATAPAGWSFEVENKGRSGEAAIEEMERRLPNILQRRAASNERIDWVVILGGTNDIGSGSNSDEIIGALKNLHASSHNHGARTIALTIPETDYEEISHSHKLIRLDTNNMLREYALSSENKVLLLDLAALIPYHSLDDGERAALWDDGLHFTEAGYDRIGEAVYKVLMEGLQIPSSSSIPACTNADPNHFDCFDSV
eukprot:Opistho-2@44412